MAYSTVADLLLGDTMVSTRVDRQKFVNDAAEEIDSKLGFIYETTPFDVDSPLGLPRHQALLLKHINNKLASGRLILTLDIAGEQTTLHAYGWRLVKEATAELMLIANGTIDLEAPKIGGGEKRMDPAIIHHDEESLLLGFENQVLRGQPWYTRPGRVT